MENEPTQRLQTFLPIEEKEVTLLSETELYTKWKDWNEEERYNALMFQNFSIQFIKDHIDEINWYALSLNLNLTYDIIDAFRDKIKWSAICVGPNRLSEPLLYNYYTYIDWTLVLPKQFLDIELLVALSEKYRKSRSKKAKLFWNSVAKYQYFDVEYVDAYKRFLDFEYLSMNPNLDDETIDKYFTKFNLASLFKVMTIDKKILLKHAAYIRSWYAEHDKA